MKYSISEGAKGSITLTVEFDALMEAHNFGKLLAKSGWIAFRKIGHKLQKEARRE